MALSKISQRSPFDKYDVGDILTLNILPERVSASQELQVRVRQLQLPRTLSCGMVVDILDGCSQGIQPTTAFLKLFDRRFADQLRDDNTIEPWEKDMEESYIEFVQSGEVLDFLDNLRHVKDFQEDTEDDWDEGQEEACLTYKMLELYTTEVGIYNELRRYQGSRIPRLYAAVNLDLTPPNVQGEVSRPEELFQVKGILLQYIEGFSLSDLPDRAPQSSWQNIVDQALSIVHVLGDNNILNKDVRPGNFMVSPKGDGEYQVFMIDFALCRFRGEGESDFNWGRAKYSMDEEGRVGQVMKGRLGEHGFELNYKKSMRYFEWAKKEGDGGDLIDKALKYRYVLPGGVVYSRVPLPKLEYLVEHVPCAEQT